MLEESRILLGVSGGIACYKSAEVIRALRAIGAEVRVMMTANACNFITPLTLQTLSGNPVSTDTFDLGQESGIGHIDLADSADAILIAPATANVIGKLANGLADDILTTVALATRAPIVVAPAMNVHMWENSIVQENIDRLRTHGFHIIEPDSGSLACGYEGKGRLPDPEILISGLRSALTTQDLKGRRVVVTAGPNREAIDPVRFISNRSTGKMGFAVAEAAQQRGAEVVLIAGPTQLPTPQRVHRIDVETSAEMRDALSKEFDNCHILFMAAAVADFRPAECAEQKIKKGDAEFSLALERTTDILAELAEKEHQTLIVGFAAETENVVANAQRKLHEKNLDLIVANDVAGDSTGFAVDTNAVTVIGRGDFCEHVPLMTKFEVAHRIIDLTMQYRSKAETTSA